MSSKDYRYFTLREYLNCRAYGDLIGLCAEIVVLWRSPSTLINDMRYKLALLHLESDSEAPLKDIRGHVILWQPGSLWQVDIVDCRELIDPMSHLLDDYPEFSEQLKISVESFYCQQPLLSIRPKEVKPLRLEHLIWRKRTRKSV